MFRIQNMAFKKILFFGIFFIMICNQGEGQVYRDELKKADSLFKEKKYTESYRIYQHILEEGNAASPAMLLKMAFIREGLGDYSHALYYLNLYYLQTHNKRALNKMEDIAETYNLSGYQYTDLEFFLNIFYRYYILIILALGSTGIFLLSYIVYKRKRLKEKPGYSFFYLILVVMAMFAAVNYGKSYRKGIIVQPGTYVMQGPSAGSELLTVAGQGHRLKILGKEDVWVKVKWNDQEAFIKEDNIVQVTGD